MKQQKVNAFNQNLEEMAKKFQNISQKIKEKEQLFMELAQNTRDS